MYYQLWYFIEFDIMVIVISITYSILGIHRIQCEIKNQFSQNTHDICQFNVKPLNELNQNSAVQMEATASCLLNDFFVNKE